MKKFVVLVAMFVCGGSFVAMAQEPVKTQPSTEQVQEEKEETVGESTEEAPSTETVEESTSESAE